MPTASATTIQTLDSIYDEGPRFVFGQSPIDDGGDLVAGYAALLQRVKAVSAERGVAFDFFDLGILPGKWDYHFSAGAVAAVAPEMTIIVAAGGLDAAGADAMISQATGAPGMTLFRADHEAHTPCIMTFGPVTTNLMCGGFKSVVLSVIVPPTTDPQARAEQQTELVGIARELVASKFRVTPEGG